MTQPNHYLVVTDGTTTATFANGVGTAQNYALEPGWSPAVATLRQSELGGRGPYEDVVEEWPFSVSGSTPAHAQANLAALNRLIEQAERFERGENVSAVLVKFAPLGSTVAASGSPYQARILGYANGGALNLGSRYFQAPVAVSAGAYRINGLRLRFRRQGAWLHNEVSASTAAASNGEVVMVTPASLADPGPTKVVVTNYGYGYGASNRYYGGFLLLGEPVNVSGSGRVPMVVNDATFAAGSSGKFSHVAESGTNAVGGSVLRYTPTDTSEYFSGGLGPLNVGAPTSLVAVFANVRPSTTVSFRLRFRLVSLFMGWSYTGYVAVPAETIQYPRWIFCGYAPIRGTLQGVLVGVTAETASSSLDIDSIAVCDARAIRAVALVGESNQAFTPNAGSLTVDHQLLTATAPYIEFMGASAAVAYKGDAVFFTGAGSLYGLLLATGGGSGSGVAASAGNEWRQASTSSDATLTNAWHITRRAAYLVPR